MGALNETKIKHIMAQVRSFPAMLEAAVKMLSLLNNPDTTASQIEKVLRYEPVLTANALSLMTGIGAGRDGLRYKASASVTKRLGLKAAHLETAASQVLQGINQLSDDFGC